MKVVKEQPEYFERMFKKTMKDIDKVVFNFGEKVKSHEVLQKTETIPLGRDFVSVMDNLPEELKDPFVKHYNSDPIFRNYMEDYEKGNEVFEIVLMKTCFCLIDRKDQHMKDVNSMNKIGYGGSFKTIPGGEDTK